MTSPKLLLAAGLLLAGAGIVIVLQGPGEDGSADGSGMNGAPATSSQTAGGPAGVGGSKSGNRVRPSSSGGTDDPEGTKTPRDRATAATGDTDPERSPKALLQNILQKKREGLAVFDENYKLNPELAEALNLTEAEFDLLGQTLLGSLEKIDELRAENVEVRQKSDSQLFLKVRSFAEEGAEVQASLEDSLRQQLGDERYASFMLMSGDALTDQYFDFGRAYQTISFNVYDSQNDGARRIRIVDRLHVPQTNGEWAVIENKNNYDSLPAGYAPFFNLANSGAPQPIDPSTLPQPAPSPESNP